MAFCLPWRVIAPGLGRAISEVLEMSLDVAFHGYRTHAIRGIRVAVVARADQAQPDRLWETITRNRGVTARIVADPTEALEWILDESAGPVRSPRAPGAYRPTRAVA